MSAALAVAAILVSAYVLWRLRKLEKSLPPPDERKAWEAAVRKVLGS